MSNKSPVDGSGGYLSAGFLLIKYNIIIIGLNMEL